MNSKTMHSNAQSDYPPLSEIRKSFRVKWYRCPIEHARLKELSERTDRQGWIQAGGHLLLYVVLAATVIFFWIQQLWVAFIAALWCLGFVATFFKGASTHELGHGTVFKTKALNSVFLHIFCMISWWDPYDYAASHTYHHRFTAHPKADRENLHPLTPSLHPWLLVQLFTFSLFLKPGRNFSKGGFLWSIYLTARTSFGLPAAHTEIPSQEWLHALHQDQPEAFRHSIRWSRALLVFHSSVLMLAILSGWWVLPLVLTVPSYIANIGSYLLGTTQHCGLQENNADFRQNTRSIKINPLLGFLYWYMNWHTEHHMYAGVPCYNLKHLGKELEIGMPEPKSLLGAWKEMREIWKRKKTDRTFEFIRPVPSHKGMLGGQGNDDIVNSIGDLAPKHSRIT